MKNFLASILLSLGVAVSALASASNIANVNKSGFMLDGYDAVSYFQSEKPLRGDPKYLVKQGDVSYLFANEANKQLFLKDPKKYQPEFEGWCAYAVADSKSKVDVDPNSFLIQDGKLLLFYKGVWGDTRKKWLHTEGKDVKAFLKQAEQNWPDVKSKEL